MYRCLVPKHSPLRLCSCGLKGGLASAHIFILDTMKQISRLGALRRKGATYTSLSPTGLGPILFLVLFLTSVGSALWYCFSEGIEINELIRPCDGSLTRSLTLLNSPFCSMMATSECRPLLDRDEPSMFASVAPCRPTSSPRLRGAPAEGTRGFRLHSRGLLVVTRVEAWLRCVY